MKNHNLFESLSHLEQSFHNRTLPNYKSVFLAYLDILGYKNLVKDENLNAPTVISKIIFQSVDPSSRLYKHIKISLLSDAVIATSSGNHPAEFFNVLNVVQLIVRSLWDQGLLSRGGIALGNHSQNHDLIVSPVLIDAYALEQKADYPRILVSDNARNAVLPACKLISGKENLHVIEYDGNQRIVDKSLIMQDEEDLAWIVDSFASEPLYYLKNGYSMNHLPCDPPPTNENLALHYAEAVKAAANFREIIRNGLLKSQNNPRHYRKWHYLVRKFNLFLAKVRHLTDFDHTSLFIHTNEDISSIRY